MVTILTAIIFTFTLQDEVERVVICARKQVKEQNKQKQAIRSRSSTSGIFFR
jgi:hypothetical protein